MAPGGCYDLVVWQDITQNSLSFCIAIFGSVTKKYYRFLPLILGVLFKPVPNHSLPIIIRIVKRAAQKAGIISLDWASFNLVLGALSNTVVKLFFVYTLGHRKLFRQLSLSFFIISVVGIITTLVYYELW